VEIGEVCVFDISREACIDDGVVMKVENELKNFVKKILDAPFFPSIRAQQGLQVPFVKHGMKVC